ncbi:hypothetical protein OQA88_9818 [Cercophora sp. LCS_1]
MRIRLPFAGVFVLLLLLAAYAGLSSLQPSLLVNDKLLHVFTFFLLTVVFYWVVDTNRRRTLNLTLLICTLGLGIGSEFLQALLPNGREFDLYDLVANVVGSLAGLGLCSWYHKRMLERKRTRKNYTAVPGDDGDEEIEEDLELGEGVGSRRSGDASVGDNGTTVVAATQRTPTLEEEVDNWDENADDPWDDDDLGGDIGVAGTHAEGDKKRAD